MTHFDYGSDPGNGDFRRPPRPLGEAVNHGARMKCPKCGNGALYSQYLKVVDQCNVCGEELHHHRADDAPAYFTIAIVGKLIVSFFVWLEFAYAPPLWVHAVVWTPVLIAMALTLLPVIKGVIVAIQWANYMHGFDGSFSDGDDIDKHNDPVRGGLESH